MKFLANENFPRTSVLKLIEAKLDLTSIGIENPSVSDKEIIEAAIKENRTILTFDKDYGELVYKFGYKPKAGVVFFRTKSYQPEDPAEWVLELLSNKNIQLEGLFTVVDENNIRQRKI
jgi:predicted nuclease of predicted toxin-antitoxin system